MKNSFEFCHKFQEFYALVYSKSSKTKKGWVINPDIKRTIRRNFNPMLQHDSHEFMIYLFAQLQDE
jgi:hypothetical protein